MGPLSVSNRDTRQTPGRLNATAQMVQRYEWYAAKVEGSTIYWQEEGKTIPVHRKIESEPMDRKIESTQMNRKIEDRK